MQFKSDVVIFAIHKLNDLMTDKRTQNIKDFLSELSGKALAYLFPGVDKETIDGQSDDLAQCPDHSGTVDFPVMAYGSQCPPAEEWDEHRIELDKHLKTVRRSRGRQILFTKSYRNICEESFSNLYDEEQESPLEEPAVLNLEPDEQTKAILTEIETLQRKYGITIKELEAILVYKVKLSRLHITVKKAVILEDFDRREVKMDTLTKAVFLLYLKHPEGIRYKDLSDYQQELEGIYSSITGREDLDSIRKSVADLCDPLNNSINEKVSKVKKAFKDAVDDHVARFYYIDGKKGTAKRIALDRGFVLWE